MLQQLLDWMETQFNGNLDDTAALGATEAIERGWVSGTLWEESGERILRVFFQNRLTSRRQSTRDPSTRAAILSATSAEELPHTRLQNDWLYFVGDEIIDVLRLTRGNLQFLIEKHRRLADSHDYECTWFTAVRNRLGPNQVVGDVFDREGLWALRSELAA